MSSVKRYGKDGGSREVAAELESQFVLRLPPTPATALKACLRSGVMNIKDRLTITLEPDNRKGVVVFDKWYLPCRVVDLPCIIESHKTLDGKTFYKTADIAQMMICYEDQDMPKSDDESPKKAKDRKSLQEKKYQYPHGITAPLKNVRKRRFRKTLKKKYVDLPEIEKEVKRLFRQDNEAIAIRYEVVSAEDEGKSAGPVEVTGHIGPSAVGSEGSGDLVPGEHDLFGEVLSSSDDEVNILDDAGNAVGGSLLDEEQKVGDGNGHFFINDYSQQTGEIGSIEEANSVPQGVEDYDECSRDANESATRGLETEGYGGNGDGDSNNALLERLTQLEEELAEVQERRQAQESHVASIENQALKMRFQSILQELREEEARKQNEYDAIVNMLHQE